ncbi:phosphoadenylyl-sulfate reductase [Hazenella coriacea]|nr:phosphoadenylyl-sulfate reductase [Hazenella coriacea]
MEDVISPESCKEVAFRLKEAHPMDVIRWGVENVGSSALTLACSFGYEDVALVDMVSKIEPDLTIFYLDTDLLFPETYQVRDRLVERYSCQFKRVCSDVSITEQTKQYGEALWTKNPHQCCRIRKVEPLKKVLQGYQGWITGIRREQSLTRAHAEVVEWDEGFGLVKLNPLAYWTSTQVWKYIHEHQIPYNPLHDQNFPSIGCEPCTQAVLPGEDPRSGRWTGTEKTECGLHNSPSE